MFCDGTVNANGEFDKMRGHVLKFGSPPCFNEIVARVRSIMNLDVDESDVTVCGMFDASRGGKSHYVVMELASEDDWKLYKNCDDSQVCCAEVVVDVGICGSSMILIQEVRGRLSPGSGAC